MSVLIKGMEKPDNCEICPYAFCHLDTRNCPIVAIPDHGDLIDRDTLPKYTGYALSANDVANAVINAKVVIPAERSEDG